jgi:hypothetical protein
MEIKAIAPMQHADILKIAFKGVIPDLEPRRGMIKDNKTDHICQGCK